MKAGIARSGRIGLALLTALAMVTALAIVLAGPAAADHQPDDVVPHSAAANDAPFWVNYLSEQRGINGASCTKLNESGPGSFTMPEAPDGRIWVLLVIKQASGTQANTVFYDPIAGHEYDSVQDQPGYSHIIVCSVEKPEETTTTTTLPEETTTTTVPEETTTTTVPEETTTTTLPEETTTTEPEETTTTTVEDEVLGEEVTTTEPEETTTTVEDEVLSEELPFTGIENEGLAMVAAALTTLGLLVTLSARRIEE